MDLDTYLKSTGKTVDDLRKDLHEEAEKDVRRDLVLDAIADKENTQVPEEAVNQVVEAFARQTGSDTDTIKTTLQFRGALDGIVRDLRRLEVLKKLTVKAAEKAGTPLPLEEKKAEEVDEDGKAADEDAQAAAPGEAAEVEPLPDEKRPQSEDEDPEPQPEDSEPERAR
jgi:FKBP-type peptidyl-prolyl cis-trans isomerase (trigger factor)